VEMGSNLLIVSVFTLLLSALLFLYAIKRKNHAFAKIGELLLYSTFVLCFSSLVLLEYYFITDEFSITYVYLNSQRTLPLIYKISAVWAGMEGSLLLWTTFILAISSIYISTGNKNEAKLKSAAILAILSIYILLINFLYSNPFVCFQYKPNDGLGLNPLLRTPEMIFHPPTIFLGYALTMVPYASYLAGYSPAKSWIKFAWTSLTIGIILGCWWAYKTLGWGGFWGWDPVENASLLPWLSLTAYFHSKNDIEREFFAYLSFILVLFATFITRSGLTHSVHEFGVDTFGWFYLLFIIITSFSFYKLYRKLKQGGANNKANNIRTPQMLMCACLIVIFIGTASSIFMSTSRLYYLLTFTPIYLVIVLYILHWIRKRKFRRISSLILHIGIIILFIGSTGVWFLEREYQVHLNPECTIDNKKIKLLEIRTDEDLEKHSITAIIKVNEIGIVKPKLYVYKTKRSDNVISSVELVSNPLYDYYFAIRSINLDKNALDLDFYIVPLISFVWLSFIILIFSVFLSFLSINPRSSYPQRKIREIFRLNRNFHR